MKKNLVLKNAGIALLGILAVLLSSFTFGQTFDVSQTGKELSSASGFYDLRLINFDRNFFIRLAVNLISMIVLIRFIYYKVYRRREFFFTFFMFNLVIFIITFLLNANSGFSIGAAFGLFAIFAMLRYRTEDISARDMTYLFLSITLGLISAVNMGTLIELVLIDLVIVLGAFFLEGNLFGKPEFFKTVDYEKIELITPERRAELIDDLRMRTGLNVHKVYIKKIDFLRDTALLKIYYYDEENHEA